MINFLFISHVLSIICVFNAYINIRYGLMRWRGFFMRSQNNPARICDRFSVDDKLWKMLHFVKFRTATSWVLPDMVKPSEYTHHVHVYIIIKGIFTCLVFAGLVKHMSELMFRSCIELFNLLNVDIIIDVIVEPENLYMKNPHNKSF